MTLYTTPTGLALELDRPEIELHVYRCPCGCLHAAWLASQTGRRVAWQAVGAC